MDIRCSRPCREWRRPTRRRRRRRARGRTRGTARRTGGPDGSAGCRTPRHPRRSPRTSNTNDRSESDVSSMRDPRPRCRARRTTSSPRGVSVPEALRSTVAKCPLLAAPLRPARPGRAAVRETNSLSVVIRSLSVVTRRRRTTAVFGLPTGAPARVRPRPGTTDPLDRSRPRVEHRSGDRPTSRSVPTSRVAR